jgi:hypothetical protein
MTSAPLDDFQRPSGLGRWSGFQFALANNKILHIITAYRPNIDNKFESTTNYQKQIRLLRDQEVLNPEPRQKMLKDLKTFINKVKHQHHELILMWDANETLDSAPLQEFLQETSLYSLTGLPPPELTTYARGKSTIYHILGTKFIQQHVQAAGYLPFYEGAWHSDH